MIFKVTTNIRADDDLNYAFTTEAVVDTQEEAWELGRTMHKNIIYYMSGSDQGAKELDNGD